MFGFPCDLSQVVAGLLQPGQRGITVPYSHDEEMIHMPNTSHSRALERSRWQAAPGTVRRPGVGRRGRRSVEAGDGFPSEAVQAGRPSAQRARGAGSSRQPVEGSGTPMSGGDIRVRSLQWRHLTIYHTAHSPRLCPTPLSQPQVASPSLRTRYRRWTTGAQAGISV